MCVGTANFLLSQKIMADGEVRVTLPPPISSSNNNKRRLPRATRPSPSRKPSDELLPPQSATTHTPRKAWGAARWALLNSGAIVALAVAGAVYVALHAHAQTQPQPQTQAFGASVQPLGPPEVREAGGAPRRVAFTLVPAPESAGKWMRLGPQPAMRFARLLHYDVCCFAKTAFVCRSATRSLAVEAYISDTREVTVHVMHPDMVGARCRLTWTEEEEEAAAEDDDQS